MLVAFLAFPILIIVLPIFVGYKVRTVTVYSTVFGVFVETMTKSDTGSRTALVSAS